MAQHNGGNADPINPPHYCPPGAAFEAIDVIEAFGLGFELGNVVKYVLRADRKGEALDDLRKAHWYLEREIARRVGPQHAPTEPPTPPATMCRCGSKLYRGLAGTVCGTCGGLAWAPQDVGATCPCGDPECFGVGR